MGTREVYEQKLRNGNLYHEPTINPGLGSPRCPRCLSLLDPQAGNGEWTITPVLHDTTAVAGSGLGALLSAVHGFNTGIPFIQNRVRGPKWLPFVVGLPPLLLFSGVSAAFGEIIILGVLKASLKSLIYEGHPHKDHSHTSIFVIAYFTGYICISSVRKTAECLKSLAFFNLLILVITPCDLVATYRADVNRLTCTGYALSAAYALPKFAQLTVTSYYAASSASHYWISLLTRKIEEVHTSQAQKGKVK